MPSPTDAYGTIEFQGGPHPTKAQYVRLAYDTRPDLIVQLFTREWNLELPKLLITVQGGKANFELQPKLKKVLRKGLLKAAKTTGAWIFTGGTNTGVTRQVGDALLLERSQRSGRVISIGIAPWGIVENNHELVGHNRDVPYHSISSPRSKYAVLNNRHAYFLLVDNGTGGRYGAEIILRRKLEKYISNQKLHPYTHSSTPVVCLVIEGGTNTIRAVLEYVTDTPPVPVVVCDGSGRAADLIAFTHKYASETGEQNVLESMKDYLINTIQRTFEVGLEQAECLYSELLQCTRNKKLITIFRISERSEDTCQELDQTILTALFKSQHLSPSEQLSLALTWNRVDIARSEIFIYGQEWPAGALDEAMMQALEHDRIDFVKLLLENGVSMKKFLTIPRLEELYNTKQGPSNTLGYILRDVRPHIPRGYMYTLHDIGLVINKLMGGAYRAYYTRRKFRPIYAKVMNKSPHVHRNSASFIRYYYGNTLSVLAEALPATKNMALFDYPFNELLIWAVLTKRQQMALLMWQHGEEALAKSLVACKLYKAMAHEAAEDDLETEIYEELRNYGKEFDSIALELLDFCYRQDDDQTQQLLTCELQNWSGQTCLSLAVAANHRALLAHPCSQIILADLWMGGLRTRKNTNIKVILGLFFPIYIYKLEFKSKEELQLMPQTEEEHLENESLDDDAKQDDKPLDGEALIGDNFSTRETVVHENGKVMPDCDEYKEYLHIPLDYYEIKQNRPLRLKKKLYEFYTAPITKFWANAIAYVFFLMIFSYTVLVKMEPEPSWQELFSIAYISTLGCEKIREIVSSEPVAVSHKFAVWAWNMWNPCDAAAIIFFLIGLSLRLKPSTMDVGRVIYCVDSIYWYLRILNILGVNKYLGPLVTMMGKMVKNMIYFVVLLAVVLMSFGVSRQAILFPNSEPGWYLAKEIFYQPYFMLYGEVFADSIDPPCGEQAGMEPCQTGRWITPTVMSTYLLVANILLINLLIAVFNNIFNEVNAVSHQVWMFQRFTVVMEYEQKPVLPPPLIILCHIFLILKYLKRKIKGVRETYDNGLKLFLEKDDLERLYDFEEECVEGYFREKELKLQQSTDERIKCTNERVENLYQKIEDIYQKENTQQNAIQSIEFRLRKIDEVAEQTVAHLAVIHRFMATHIQDQELPEIKVVTERFRKASERSDGIPEGDSHLSLHPPRRRVGRSLTEVRPDAYIFDDGLHFEVRPLEEEDEGSDTLDNSRPKLNLEDKQRSSESKASIIEEEDEFNDVKDDVLVEINENVGSIESFRVPHSLYKRRDSDGTGRRSSEGGGGEVTVRGHLASFSRRQLSQTHSEPDNTDNSIHIVFPQRAGTVERGVPWVEPKIKVIPPGTSGGGGTSNRSMLLAMHTEYTSITDELETVCGLLSPPKTPRLLSPPRPGQAAPQTPPRRKRHASEMSNPEMALYLEKEHLRDAEESDYLLMENLIQRRYDDPEFTENDESSNACYLSVVHEHREFRHPKGLRRSSAVEVGDFPTPVHEIFPSCNEADETAEEFIENLLRPSTSGEHNTTETAERQNSCETNQTSSSGLTSNVLAPCDTITPRRPTIVIDSSQLPIQKPITKSDSNTSLHMQSETMC
ncbi:transient receptor potential cation channel trpm isoform X2 [Chrysoperla carnea]|uniref:transient receptor potential cation channel trpm isoform X2 n=1 Tax=Chrysoperla carnea TaxID=189513 RepID=UPI001D08EFE8|nr:transient receptor potential cation channel trpm isoform X2 [Chrysoperla carnea]XP_044737221.1 transient receptor potential cation channel trpm isoform X2 [Chrysoperla carnea]